MKKVKLAMVAIAILTAILYIILDKEEFVEFWKSVGACIALGIIILIGWNYDSPADRSRDTIDWEMEQERREKEEEEENAMKLHGGSK